MSYLMGICRVGDELCAEFGPKIFQHAEAKQLATAVYSLERLRTRFENIAKGRDYPQKQNYLGKLEAAITMLAEAERRVNAGESTLEDFPEQSPTEDFDLSPFLTKDGIETLDTAVRMAMAEAKDVTYDVTVKPDTDSQTLARAFDVKEDIQARGVRHNMEPRPLPPIRNFSPVSLTRH